MVEPFNSLQEIVIHTPSEIIESADQWTNQLEDLVTKWRSQVEKLSHIHQESGYILKTRFYRLSIPSIVIPFIMVLISQLTPTCNQYEPTVIANGFMFMITSGLSAMTMFFNYGFLYEQHFQYSARYNDIATVIDSELAKHRNFRTSSDVFITEVKCRIEALNDSAPNIPGNYC